MIKHTRRNLKKDSESFFVVTRDGRRVEEDNYKSKDDAEIRAEKLIAMIKKYSPHETQSVCIVHTSEPKRIR
tara:strand:+ start:1751 stop:1966 length:216 start_codon:yes stop_codon:yes gene_type:complete